jgi:hypothetical protein
MQNTYIHIIFSSVIYKSFDLSNKRKIMQKSISRMKRFIKSATNGILETTSSCSRSEKV